MSKWNGYIDKLKHLKQYIDPLPPDDIVCFIDGYDVLINSDPESILRKFKEADCSLLFGAELNCFPVKYQESMDLATPDQSVFYRYLNSGGYIGYNHAIRDFLHWKSEEEMAVICLDGGDQSYATEYYLAHLGNNVKLDIHCEIFQNMHWVDWDCIKWNRGIVHNTVMNTTPCFIHFNGGVWQTNTGENIMPVFVAKMRESRRATDEWLGLDGYEQITTDTCYPHRQR